MPRARRDPPHAAPAPHAQPTGRAGARARPELSSHLLPGLRQLLRAYEYAHGLGQAFWQFATEIECLRAAGLTNNDLRWLVTQGYLEHALEQTPEGMNPRQFCPAGPFTLFGRSCFVLTPAGLEMARDVLARSGEARPAPAPGRVREDAQAGGAEVPYWDAEQHTLYWRGRPVKHFKREAPYQEAVLRTFQGNGWVPCVRVTLPKDEGVNPKERLRETIRNLNRSCAGALRFTQEGNGSRVGWAAPE